VSTLEELKQQLGYRPPLRHRPRCQHISFDRQTCDRPAEHECDPGPDGHRPRFVCSGCLQYQVAGIGPITLIDEVEGVRFNAEGGIAKSRRSRR
jgi:hypothetical protein